MAHLLRAARSEYAKLERPTDRARIQEPGDEPDRLPRSTNVQVGLAGRPRHGGAWTRASDRRRSPRRPRRCSAHRLDARLRQHAGALPSLRIETLDAAPARLELARMTDAEAAGAIADAWLRRDRRAAAGTVAIMSGTARQAANGSCVDAGIEGGASSISARGLLGALPEYRRLPVQPRQGHADAAARAAAAAAGRRRQRRRVAAARSAQSSRFSFTLRFDATDQLAEGNPIAAASGILPTLSALELLMVPKSSLVDRSVQPQRQQRSRTSHPPAQPADGAVLLGAVPHPAGHVTSLSITETEYDMLLNPVRAEVIVNLQVLTPSQLARTRLWRAAPTTTREKVKEVMAALNLANAAQFGVSASLSVSLCH